jgi:Hint domain-containing protein
VLINAHKLVNGVSIVQDLATSAVHYFHVELDQHDILLAEGMPTESYLDTGNRDFFANSSGAVALYADSTPKRMQTDACLPFVESGPQLAAVRRRLIEGIVAQGWTISHDPALHLVVNGGVVRPAAVEGDVYRFELPATVRDLRIVSRTHAPGGVSPDNEDMRRLGVCLGGIALAGDGETREIAIDNPALDAGFRPVETNGSVSWRWTDGDARLPAGLLTGPARGTLELRLLWPGAYWTRAEHPDQERLSA